MDLAPVMVATHDIPREVKEAAVIERRRELEKARAERIFDVKNRTIGIDTAALEAQIAAKKRVEELEKERERTLDAAMIATAQQADILQQEVDRMKAAQLRDLTEYRARNQAKTNRREYDLSDPDALKNEEIPTVCHAPQFCFPPSKRLSANVRTCNRPKGTAMLSATHFAFAGDTGTSRETWTIKCPAISRNG
eukprot:SAG31_NODE_326_length_17664_cov_10.038543_21_plen_194_part_00